MSSEKNVCSYFNTVVEDLLPDNRTETDLLCDVDHLLDINRFQPRIISSDVFLFHELSDVRVRFPNDIPSYIKHKYVDTQLIPEGITLERPINELCLI